MNETMMKMILKTLNIDPEKFKENMMHIQGAAKDSEARLKRIEEKIDTIIARDNHA